MSAALQKAIDCLRIRDVSLRRSSSHLVDGFDPKYSAEVNQLSTQFKHLVTQGEILALEENDAEINLFRIYIDLGARWVVLPEPSSEEEKDKPEIKAVVEATFLAEYLMEDEPGQDALNAFALKNASYHVWPYWREYLMSQCARMILPKVILPAVQFAGNHKDSVGLSD